MICKGCGYETGSDHPRHYTLQQCTQARLVGEHAAMKARFTAPIVCLCGSTRFKRTFRHMTARLSLDGYIVLGVALWNHGERVELTEEQKRHLDNLHKRKIDLCDEVYVLDVGGYVGESTRSEIECADRIGRPVRYLSDELPGYREPADDAESIAALLSRPVGSIREAVMR